MEHQQTPADLREGVRAGVQTTLERDVELRGGRTARLLAAAGVIGVVGAVGLTLLVSGHPFDHHPPWHVLFFTATWAGLLVVSLALSFLQVRTPSLQLARSASVAVLGLGLAGICGALCPDPHFLRWWSRTEIGGGAAAACGQGCAALCFGLLGALLVGAVAAFVVLGAAQRQRRVPTLLPAALLLMLLSPGVALQSVGTSLGVFAGFLLGTAAGCYAGIAAGSRLRARFRPL
jgi:hypothetical protein